MVLCMFQHKYFAEGSGVQNYVHAFNSFVTRTACEILVLTSGPQEDISAPSHSMTIHVTLKIISLLLNTSGNSPGILAFTAS